MQTNNPLLARLDEIGQSLESSGHALALIGLGSVGLELERLDAWSDLDFFAIVESGYKARYIDNIDWLTGLGPVAYHFRNSRDGYKLLFQDGIFCEFAVFEQSELGTIQFTQGRVVWKRPEVDQTIGTPLNEPAPITAPAAAAAAEHQLGEALTNIFVGLGRFRRGEKLSAERFIQHYAVDRILELAVLLEKEAPGFRDQFGPERRFEQRFPGLSQELAGFIQGYERSPESALAILDFLERHFEVNRAIAAAIRKLLQNPS